MQDLIDSASFAHLRQRMAETSPVARLIVEFDLDELRLEATAESQGFKVRCKKSGDSEITWSYLADNEYSGTVAGNFVIEGVNILIYFLKKLGRNAEIGQFQMSFGLPRSQETTRIQWDFFNTLFEYLEGRDPFLLKVGQFVMKHDGLEDVASGISSYLELVKLFGDEELVFTPIDEILEPTELQLIGVYKVETWQKPKRLTVQGHFWTEVDCEEWAKFRHISTTCRELTTDTIEDLIDKFIPSSIFKSCVITTLIENPDIQQHFDSLPDYQRLESHDAMKWKVQGVDVQFTFSVQGNKCTFERFD